MSDTTAKNFNKATGGCGLDHRILKIGPCNLRPFILGQHSILEAGLHQIGIKFTLILEIYLGLSAFGAEQRRLGDVEEAGLDQRTHMPEEECQQQGTDMAAINIGICHDNDFVIARLIGFHFIIPDSGTNCRNQGANLGRGQHLVEPCALNIQDFTPQRQDCLIGPVAPLFCRAAGGITLNQEDL